MITTLIFDADGTLYRTNTEQAYQEMIETRAAETGKQAEQITKQWKTHLDELKKSDDPADRHRATPIERALEDLGVNNIERGQIIKEALDVFWEQVVADLEIDAAVPEIFAEVDDAGIKQMFVASDEFRIPLEKKLAAAEAYWDSQFDEIVTPETVDAMKPSPKFITYLIERYDLDPSSCMVIGDSWERDLKAAADKGMKTILKAENVSGNPDHTITTLDELPAILKQYR